MKGSYTVEAALILPFICMLLCASMLVTLMLYERVAQYGKEKVAQLRDGAVNVAVMRMERLLYEDEQE